MPPLGTTQFGRSTLTAPGTGFYTQGFSRRTMFETIPGRSGFHITKETFKAIEEYIKWAEYVPRKLPKAMDLLARMLANTHFGYAQAYSAGWKRDAADTARAWAMPVPRITWRYYMGWRVQRLRLGTWILTNESREAFYIEFGIQRNPRTGQVSPRRIRRPVMKLSFRKTLTSAAKTAISHRVMTDALYPRPGEPGTRARQFLWQSPPIRGFSVLQSPHGAVKDYGQPFSKYGPPA